MTIQNKNYFSVFYDSFNSLQFLNNEELGIIFRAMFDYQINQREPKVTENNSLNIAWATVKAMLDRHNSFRQAQSAKRGRSKEVTKGNRKLPKVTPSPNPCPNPKPNKEIYMQVLTWFNSELGRNYSLTKERIAIIESCLAKGRNIVQIKQAISNFKQSEYHIKNNYVDLIYAIGQQRGKADNFDRWYSSTPEQKNKDIIPDHMKRLFNGEGV